MNTDSKNIKELNQEELKNNSEKIKIEYHPHGLYYVIPSQIMDSKLLSSTEKLCYGLLSGLANEHGTCFPSDNYLVERLGSSIVTVKRAIKKLTDMGLISKYTDRSNMMRPKRIITILNICSSKNDTNVRYKNDTNVRYKNDTIESKEELESKERERAPVSKVSKEKLKGRATHVDTTDSEHKKLEESFGKEKRDWCYNRLSEWKQDKPKRQWSKCDYRTILRWVADAYHEDQLKVKKRQEIDSVEKNKTMADKIATNFKERAKDHGIKIEALNKTVEFVFLKSQKHPIVVPYSEKGFKEQIDNLMRKLRLI
jgi:hypothetical protein